MRKRFSLLVTELLILTVGRLSSQTPLPQDRANQQKRSEKANHETTDSQKAFPAPSAPMFESSSQPKPKTEQTETNNQARKFWEKAFAPELWSNWALAVLAFIGAFFTYHTWRALKRQVTANERAAEAAERALFLTERADIQIDKVQISDASTIPHSKVVVTARNFGRTRADHVVYNLRYGVFDSEQKPSSTAEQTLGAGGEIVFRTPTTILETLGTDDYRRLQSGELKFHVWGETTYRDVFGESHTLHFRAGLRGGVFDIEENRSD